MLTITSEVPRATCAAPACEPAAPATPQPTDRVSLGSAADQPPAPPTAWQANVGRWVDTRPVCDENSVFVTSVLHEVTALDHCTGETRWTADVAGDLRGQFKLSDDALLVQSQRGVRMYMVALDRVSGQELWSAEQSGQPLVDADGALFVSTRTQEGSTLQRLCPRTGEALWSLSSEGSLQSFLAPDGRLMAISGNGETGYSDLMELCKDTGTANWTFIGGRLSPRRVQFSADGSALVTSTKSTPDGDWKTFLHVLNADGSLRMSYNPQGWQRTNPVLTNDGGLVVTEPLDDERGSTRVLSLDSNGQPLWTADVPAAYLLDVAPSGTTYVACMKVYEDGSYRNVLHAFDADGYPRFALNLEGERVSGLRHGANGELALVTFDGEGGTVVRGLDPCSGEETWRHNVATGVRSVRPLEGGQLLVESDGCHLESLNLETGDIEWSFHTGQKLRPAGHMEADGRLVVADHQGNITALDTGCTSSAPVSLQGRDSFDGHWAYTVRQSTESVNGAPTTLLYCDFNEDGKYDAGSDALLVEQNGDGSLQFPDNNALSGLDADGDGLVRSNELKDRFYLWVDENRDGQMNESEQPIPIHQDMEPLVDLEMSRLHFSTSLPCQ